MWDRPQSDGQAHRRDADRRRHLRLHTFRLRRQPHGGRQERSRFPSRFRDAQPDTGSRWQDDDARWSARVSKGPIQSFTADFQRLVNDHREATAVIDENGGTLSYGQLDDLTDRMLGYLNGLGLGAGDTLLALMPNAVETALVFLACLKGGLRFAPLPFTATAAEITSAAGLVGAGFILIADPVPNRVVQQLALLTTPIKRIETGTDLAWIPTDRATAKPGKGELIITTSGSTGAAKAILIDGDALWSSGKAFMAFHGFENARCRFWNYLPMSYLGGLFNLCLIPLCTGGSFVVGEAFSGKTMLNFWDTVKRFEIDSLWMVPAIVRGLTQLADRTGRPM